MMENSRPVPEASSIVAEADIVWVGGHKKEARAGMRGGTRFTIASDEGPQLGGEDSAPTPLTYFASAVGF